jgi:hypothetical protein
MGFAESLGLTRFVAFILRQELSFRVNNLPVLMPIIRVRRPALGAMQRVPGRGTIGYFGSGMGERQFTPVRGVGL